MPDSFVLKLYLVLCIRKQMLPEYILDDLGMTPHRHLLRNPIVASDG